MLSSLVRWCLLAFFLLPFGTAIKASKRGLAFADGDAPNDILNANQSKSDIAWQYDWSSTPPAYLATSGIPYIPMQWGGDGIDNFANAVDAQGAKIILAFNEPDFINESDLNPQEAAQLWLQHIQPLKAQGIRLGAPAVTASDTGRPWLANFIAACTNCTIDFIPFHWYGSGIESFFNYIWEMHGQFPNHPLWVTEFAETSANDTAVADFLNQTITYMDTLDWIERYAWFGYFRPREGVHYNLLDINGGLNHLGQIYVGAKTVHTEALPSPTVESFTTVNGADSPTYTRVATFSPDSNAASCPGALLGGTNGYIWGLSAAMVWCTISALWILL